MHSALLSHMRTRLINKIATLPESALDELLSKTWKFARMEGLQQVVLAILNSHPNIPIDYIRFLAKKSDLLDLVDMSVKHQVCTHEHT